MKIFSPVLKGTTTVSGGTTALSGSFTGSLQGTSSYATNADLLDGVHLSVLATTGSNQFNGNQIVTGSLTTTGTITAQTLVVQTVTSSIVEITGSNQFGSTTSNTHEFTGSILVSGSVGIGVTSFNSKLSISGSNDTSATGVLEIQTPGTNLKIGGNSTYSWIQSHSSRPLYINQLGNNVIFNSGSGNVGIGTISPSYKLDVSGTGNFSGALTGTSATFKGIGVFDNSVSGDANSGIRIVAPIATTHYNWMIGAQQNVNAGFEITPSTTVGGTTFSTPSVTILQGGNVGIGNTSPSAKLSISGNNESLLLDADSNGFSGRYILLPGRFVVGTRNNGYPEIGYNFTMTGGSYTKIGNDTAWGIDFGNSNIMRFNYAATGTGAFSFNTALSINTSGNIGIGTTSPSTKLHIEGSATTGSIGTEAILTLGRALTSGVSFQNAASFNLGRYNTIGGSFESYTRLDIALKGNGAASNYTTDVNVMTLQNNGSVGIGTTSPLTLAHIQGGIQADAYWGQQFISDNRAYNTSGLGGMISLGGTWATTNDVTYFATIQGFKENTTYANYSGGLAFSTRVHNVGIAERMRITSGGNVGIGSTSANYKLTVEGPVKSNRQVKTLSYIPDSGTNNSYVHIKTNLYMGGAGNTMHIMGGFTFRGYAYSSNGWGEGTVAFHNWSGAFYNLTVNNIGNWTGFVQSPYVSADGYAVFVCKNDFYGGIVIDYWQTVYTWRDITVTAYTTSNSLTGTY